MGKITIQDLCKVLVERKGLSKKDASNFVNMMFDTIQQGLERDLLVKVKGLGTFKIIDVDSRESVNVNTGERVLIEGHSKISFIPDALMKELVNKPFSQFETVVLNEGVDFDEATNEESSMPLVDFGADESHKDNPVLLGEPETPKEPEASKASVASETQAVPGAPIASESQTTSQETEAAAPGDDIDEYEEESSDGRKWPYVLVACLIGLAAGYLLGNYFPFKGHHWLSQEVVEAQPVQAVEPAETVAPPVVEDSADLKPVAEEPKVETPATEPKAEVVNPVEPTEKKTSELAEAKKQPEKQPAPVEKKPEPVKPAPAEQKPAEKYDKYAAMDARVRTGAYRIVGTAQVVKVKEGETLSRISRRILGPDMECYVEVYNNLKASSPLKAGQEIKIPKLEWKTKRKVQTVKE